MYLPRNARSVFGFPTNGMRYRMHGSSTSAEHSGAGSGEAPPGLTGPDAPGVHAPVPPLSGTRTGQSIGFRPLRGAAADGASSESHSFGVAPTPNASSTKLSMAERCLVIA